MQEIKADETGLYKHHFSITHELETHPWFFVVAALAVFVIITYLFARRQSTATTVPATETTLAPDTTTTTVPPPNTLPATPPPPPPAQNMVMHVRPKGDQSWDKTHPGPPYYQDPFGPSTTIPFGTAVTVLQSGVAGANHSNGGIYSKIQSTKGTGFIASQDLVA